VLLQQLFRNLHGVERGRRSNPVGVFTKETACRLLNIDSIDSVQWLSDSRTIMKIIKSMLLAAVAWGGLFTLAVPAFAQTWTHNGAPFGIWTAIASSADGSKLAAYNFEFGNSGIYTSTNSGASWTSNSTGIDNQQWLPSIASSADGTKLAAVDSPGLIYTSTNAGATWVSNSPPAEYWTSIASSADGTKLVAVASSNLIYTSTDSGVTWTSNTSVMDVQPWHFAVSSADGSILAIAAYQGMIYISTNAGTTWTSVVSVPSTNWEAIVSSADGTKLAAIARSGLVYTSPDSGTTWRSNNLPVGQWTSLASSADGSKLVAATCTRNTNSDEIDSDGSIYISTNLGANWTLSAPGNCWGFVAASADGSKLVALIGTGVIDGFTEVSWNGIYAFQTTPSPQLNLVPSGSYLDVSWIIPSTNFVLQQNSDLSTTNWTDMTNLPVLNLTNLQNEVILSPTNSSGFYRLKTL
jgi:photosystem II stability/assembly factor-like uncharacterized protein